MTHLNTPAMRPSRNNLNLLRARKPEHALVRLRRTVLGLATTLLVASLSTTAPACAQTSQTVGGISIEANWTQTTNGWTAAGQIKVAKLDLQKASATLNGNTLTGTAQSVNVKLFKGCELSCGSAAFGLATGAQVQQDVPKAPVKGSQTYLYFDAKGTTFLRCAGLKFPLQGGSHSRFYVNPSDPSFYFKASSVNKDPSGDSLASATRKLLGTDIGKVTAGASASGLIPWTATAKNAKGKRKSMNAHLVLGGDVEFKAGQIRIAVKNGSQALRFNSKHTEINSACVSGTMYIPGLSVPGVGSLDLPLGDGVACLESSGGSTLLSFDRLSVSAMVGGNAWDSLSLPSNVGKILDTFGNKPQELTGYANLSGTGAKFSIPGKPPLGPWSVDGNLTIGTAGLGLNGKTDFDVGPLDFGGLDVDADFTSKKTSATAKGKAKLGIDNAKIDGDFTLSDKKLSGSGDVKLWGTKVKGDFDFNGYTFNKADLQGGIKVSPASGKLKLKVTTSKVEVTAKGSLSPFDSFDVGVDSKGCFKTSLGKLCI